MTRSLLLIIKSNLEISVSLKNIAINLNIGYTTVKKYSGLILNEPNFIENFNDKKKLNVNNIENNHTKTQIIRMIDNQNSTTQKEIQNELRRDNIIISQSRISRFIKEADYTRKRLEKIPIQRNSPAVIEKRRLYCIGLRQKEDEDILFLDESGFNSGITRNYGYSPRGQKSVLANEFQSKEKQV